MPSPQALESNLSSLTIRVAKRTTKGSQILYWDNKRPTIAANSPQEPQQLNRMLSSMERTQRAVKWGPPSHLVRESLFQFHWYLLIHCSLSTQCLLLCWMPERDAWERKAGQEETNPYHFSCEFCFVFKKKQNIFSSSLWNVWGLVLVLDERGDQHDAYHPVLLNLFQNSKCIFPDLILLELNVAISQAALEAS